MAEKRRWSVVCLFATAMAWMEAATVIYLRTLVGRVDPYQTAPLLRAVSFEYVEIIREPATLLLLASAAYLAGHNRRDRFGYFLVAFGLWDILYYIFLAITIGWPRSLMAWDVLFLIPVPWWAPVAAPTLIALGMLICGTLITQFEPQPWPRSWTWVLSWAGVALALLVFTADARHALTSGEDAVRAALPGRFNWPTFVLALVFMAAPLVDLIRQVVKPGHSRRSTGRTSRQIGSAAIRSPWDD